MKGTSSLIPIQSGEVTAYTKSFQYDHAGRLLSESILTTLYGEGDVSAEIVYLYDGNTMIGMEYTSVNGTALYFFHRNLQGDVLGIYDMDGNLKVKYIYDAWGNCTVDSDQTTDMNLAKVNPIRYRGYYFDVDTGLYYLNARYYSPQFCRFISPDDTAYLDGETVDGLNLYAYCYNDPVNYADPSGHMPEWLKNTFKVIGAIGIVVGMTALTVVTAGAVAYLLGASTAMLGAVIAGATIGGLVAGGLEIGTQIYSNGIDGMNLGSIAIESFLGSAYGAISGVSSIASSTTLRLGMRGARIALGGIGTALHGINNGNTFGEIMLSVGISLGTGILIQGAFAGLDAYTGKLSNSILQQYLLDGALTFGAQNMLMMSGVLASKSIWRNRNLFLR